MQQPTTEEIQHALDSTGYRYTNPVLDDRYPRITEYDPTAEAHPDDLFPDAWGSEPTERDQAAIDAGRA